MKSDTQRPMEKAIELLEYLVKTEGAEHLKIASRKHNIFRLYSVDVVCFCAVIFGLSYFFLIKTIRVLPRISLLQSAS